MNKIYQSACNKPKYNLPKIISIFAAAMIGFLVSGCGFEPLYGERNQSQSAGVRQQLASVLIPEKRNRLEFLVREELVYGMTPRGQNSSAAYELDYQLRSRREELAIQQDETVTRYNYELIALYILKDRRDGRVLHQGQARSTASYNVVPSQFATLTGRKDVEARTAREVAQTIQTQIAVFFQRQEP